MYVCTIVCTISQYLSSIWQSLKQNEALEIPNNNGTGRSRYYNSLVGEYRRKFSKERSTTDQIIMLEMIQNRRYRHNLSLHVLFIDFIKVYESIEGNKVYQAIRKLEITKMTLRDKQHKVTEEGSRSNSFRGKTGVRHYNS